MGHGSWAVTAALSGLIGVAGKRLRFCMSVTEMAFTLICGASAVLILEALS
jgi:hypothetical protein